VVTYLWIAIGGALGSMARYGCAELGSSWLGDRFPWGTLAINVIGSLVIGFFGALTVPGGRFAVTPDARAFVMVGLCGGYTTFSSFSFQTLSLLREGQLLRALLYIGGSVVFCLGAVAIGFVGATALNRGA